MNHLTKIGNNYIDTSKIEVVKRLNYWRVEVTMNCGKSFKFDRHEFEQTVKSVKILNVLDNM